MTAVVLDGIVLGLAFGLLGVGMTLVYGLGGVLNLAYGQMVVLAAIVVMLVMDDGVATILAAAVGVLAVGRALMARPRLLMLDEPTTGLAPKIAQIAFEALEGLKSEGMTLLIAEQQVPLALSVADRGYVLENGHIRLSGTSEELDQNPEVRRAYLGVA